MGLCVHGHKTEHATIGEKQAYCPVCEQETFMAIVEIRKRKTIMYIPCGKGKTAGRMAVCNLCGRSFNA